MARPVPSAQGPDPTRRVRAAWWRRPRPPSRLSSPCLASLTRLCFGFAAQLEWLIYPANWRAGGRHRKPLSAPSATTAAAPTSTCASSRSPSCRLMAAQRFETRAGLGSLSVWAGHGPSLILRLAPAACCTACTLRNKILSPAMCPRSEQGRARRAKPEALRPVVSSFFNYARLSVL